METEERLRAAAENLPGANAQWVLDVYHASEHIHACGKAMFGQTNPAAKAWSEQSLMQLIQLGGPRFLEQLQVQIQSQSEQAQVMAMRSLMVYLQENRDRMWYAQRLAKGRPIGSGLIEGGCKNTIGARLKINAARWCVKRAENMGHLRCLDYSDLWTTYWEKQAA